MNYADWIGRTQVEEDIADAGPQRRLAALLDHVSPPWPAGQVPPLGHWLYFLPSAGQSQLGEDGHPKRGDFLPPVILPRRMWAGGRFTFHDAIRFGAAIQRRSTILKIAAKAGASGEMVFVTVQHEIFADGKLAVTEDHDIVYREAPKPGANAAKASGESLPVFDAVRSLFADAIQLFRYSALTYNGHRIHYDREYVTKIEGYPGLVVHGPYIATLLMDHFLREHPTAHVTTFSFRALRPLFDGEKFELCLKNMDGGAQLWARDATGNVAMNAELTAD